jgi:hypothetical protein
VFFGGQNFLPGSFKLEAHRAAVRHFHIRCLVDRPGVRKVPSVRFRDQLAHHARAQRLEFDRLTVNPLSLMIVYFTHRGHAHVMDRFAFGIIRQQARFSHFPDRCRARIGTRGARPARHHFAVHPPIKGFGGITRHQGDHYAGPPALDCIGGPGNFGQHR